MSSPNKMTLDEQEKLLAAEMSFQSVTIDVLEEYLFVDRDPTDTIKAQFCTIAETISQRSTHGGEDFNRKLQSAFEKWENTKTTTEPQGKHPLLWLKSEFVNALEKLKDEPLMGIFNLINLYVELAQKISKTMNSCPMFCPMVKGPFWRLSNKLSWIIVDPTSSYITKNYRKTVFGESAWKQVMLREWILDLKPISGKVTPPNSPMANFVYNKL